MKTIYILTVSGNHLIYGSFLEFTTCKLSSTGRKSSSRSLIGVMCSYHIQKKATYYPVSSPTLFSLGICPRGICNHWVLLKYSSFVFKDCLNFLKKDHLFLEQLWVCQNKLRERHRDFPYIPCPHTCNSLPQYQGQSPELYIFYQGWTYIDTS